MADANHVERVSRSTFGISRWLGLITCQLPVMEIGVTEAFQKHLVGVPVVESVILHLVLVLGSVHCDSGGPRTVLEAIGLPEPLMAEP